MKMESKRGEDDSMSIIVTSETEIKSFIKGYHAYGNLL